MEHLDGNIMDHILQHLCPQDLLHVERVCRHLRTVGQESTAWRSCYERQYDLVEVNTSSTSRLNSWKQVYKAAYAEEKWKNDWKIKGQIFKLTSDVQVLQQSIQRMSGLISDTRKRLKTNHSELCALQTARSNGRALQCWQPTAVRKFLEGEISSQMHLEDAWQEEDLQQTIKVLKHDLNCASNSLTAKRHRLQEKQARLQAISKP
ncbi:hypothetical protein WJX74_009895 [Apatococcus lobatus]|uniref:F-box domain-containing protein n=2 Tax=Apatococcus TaxID=904362 RepID=A0AAW1SKG7_9CHLO